MIIFCKTRWEYGSYKDFWAIVEASGFDIIYVDQIDYESDNVYIYTPMNGELAYQIFTPKERNIMLSLHGSYGVPLKWQNKKCKIIWWFLERPEDGEQPYDINSNIYLLIQDRFLDKVWVYDKGLLAWLDNPNCQYVILGSHADVNKSKGVDKVYDLANIMAKYPRRSQLFDDINSSGLILSPFDKPDCNRDLELAKTKISVSIHKDSWKWTEPIRFALSASYNMCLVTEDCGLDVIDSAVIKCTPKNAVNQVKKVLKNPKYLKEQADKLHALLCVKHRFDIEVKKAVNGL